MCVYLRLIKNQPRNSKTEPSQSLTTCYENSRRDWQNIKMATRNTGSKSAFIVVKHFTDTETLTSMEGTVKHEKFAVTLISLVR